MSDQTDHYLPDQHPLLANMVTITTGHELNRTVQQYVSREEYEVIVRARDGLRRALAMINAAVTAPELGICVRGVLDRHGETASQGEATAGVIRWARDNAAVAP